MCRSGGKALYKQAKYTLNREIRVAKKNYSGKLKTAFKQRPYISVERPESHHQLQDPIPQHWGKSKIGWRPERVLLQVWKAKAWSDTPHPLWPSHNTAINTLPLPPPTVSQPVLKICEDDKQSLQETEDDENQRPRQCLSSLPQSLCCPAIIHLHIDLQQITGAVWSPLLLQTLHHHPCTQETKNHRT